ncbi:MAG TPA: VOC family protein [Steroidobacteraceae bacterium]|nr:VOC family protein [Steroidobacteraceae bacterium]
MILGFSHYNLRAPRPLLDELCTFYCNVVGLKIGERPPFNFFGYWLYAGEQAVLHLTEARAGEARTVNAATTFDHVAFDCADREAVEQHLKSHGITFRTSTVPLTRRYQIFFKDPAGNGVELNFAQ